MQGSFEICANIISEHPIGTDLPCIGQIIICRVERGQLSYFEKIATPQNYADFLPSGMAGKYKPLVELADSLQIQQLTSYFNKNRKKKLDLPALWASDEVRPLIKQRIDRLMGQFLDLVDRLDVPLCLDLDRKQRVDEVLIPKGEGQLHPHLKFEKTSLGIKYSLGLTDADGNEVVPARHQITILCDQPAYLIMNERWTTLTAINANKLVPFLKKEELFIPDRMTKEYFQKFIGAVISKVDIETAGFEVIHHQSISGKRLKIAHDFLSGEAQIMVFFEYQDIWFGYHEPNRRRVRMEFEPEIRVTQILRDGQAEEAILHQLQEVGLAKNDRQCLTFPGVIHADALLQGLLEKRELLRSLGFDLEDLGIGHQRVLPSIPHFVHHIEKAADWFDLKMMIEVGDRTIPFQSILDNLRRKDPIFVLNESEVMIIPEAWMTRFDALLTMGEWRDNENLRVKRIHQQLIADLIPQEAEHDTPEQGDVGLDLDFDFQASPRLMASLRPYQYQGAKWLVGHLRQGFGACLADDMGLGKTLQTIAAMLYYKDHKKEVQSTTKPAAVQLNIFEQSYQQHFSPIRALVVLPSSLVYNWEAELSKFAPSLHVVRYIGPARKKLQKTLQTFDVVLTTYQTLALDAAFLQSQDFDMLILDESQMIRNRNTKLFQHVMGIRSIHKISLSGTPIENSLADLWSQMEFINPSILGSFQFFKTKFLEPIQQTKDENMVQQLKQLVAPYILRRTKKEVLQDLPPLEEQVYFSEMTAEQEKLYESEKSAARNFLLGIGSEHQQFKFHVFQMLTRLRQIASHPAMVTPEYLDESGKFSDACAYMQTVVSSGEKLLVFSAFIKHLALFEGYLKAQGIGYVQLTGADSPEERRRSVAAFQEDPSIQVFLISLKAGGVGLNLTAASYVLMLDPWWNPAVEAQAIARAHRMGQSNKVMVTRFISKNTIEEKILALQDQKKNLASEIISEEQVPDLSPGEWLQLLG